MREGGERGERERGERGREKEREERGRERVEICCDRNLGSERLTSLEVFHHAKQQHDCYRWLGPVR